MIDEYYVELLEKIIAEVSGVEWESQGLHAFAAAGKFRVTVALQGIYSAGGQSPKFVVCVYRHDKIVSPEWYAQIHRGALRINTISKNIPHTSGQYFLCLMRTLTSMVIGLALEDGVIFQGTKDAAALTSFSYLASLMGDRWEDKNGS